MPYPIRCVLYSTDLLFDATTICKANRLVSHGFFVAVTSRVCPLSSNPRSIIPHTTSSHYTSGTPSLVLCPIHDCDTTLLTPSLRPHSASNPLVWTCNTPYPPPALTHSPTTIPLHNSITRLYILTNTMPAPTPATRLANTPPLTQPPRPVRSTNPLPPSSSHRTALRPSGTTTPTTGSATQTLTNAPPSSDRSAETGLVLRLRGAHTATNRGIESGGGSGRIRWAEDVVDNEGLGRKSSKVCCIYHKPRGVGESSSEEDSSSSDEGEGSSSGGEGGDDGGGARMVGGGKGRKARGRKGRGKQGEEDEGCGHGHEHEHEHGSGGGATGKRRPSPNAYERMPRYGKKG